MRDARLVGEADADAGAEYAGRAPAARLRQALVLQRIVLADVEVDIDRVLHDDGGEDGRAGVRPAAADEVARRDEGAADAAGDRRGDAAEAQFQLRRLDARLADLHQRL